MGTIFAANNSGAISYGIGAAGTAIGAQSMELGLNAFADLADPQGVQPSGFSDTNLPVGGSHQEPVDYSTFLELLHKPVKGDPVEYADLLFETIQTHRIPAEIYEPPLRRRIGQLFSKNGMSLEALKYFLQGFGLDIEDEKPRRTTVLRGMYSWPRTIREGIYRRVFEAHFNIDPKVERLIIAGIEDARQKTHKALDNFYGVEEAHGFADKIRRAFYKREVLIAFRNDPVKFEFEKQNDHDFVFQELDGRFDARVAGAQQQFSTNRSILSTVAEEFGLKNDVQRVKQSRFNRFLNWYGLTQLKHPYLTGVATVGTGYVGGSIIATAIVGAASPVTTAQVAILGALSLYYGWETPRKLETVDIGIPVWRYTTSIDEPTERYEMYQAIKRFLSLKNPAENIKKAWERSRNINKVGRLRAEAFMFGFSPAWTVRHAAVLGIVHGKLDNAPDIALAGLATWAVTLPPIVYLVEPFIQGRIPLKYRFLSQTGVIVAWHTVASLFALTNFTMPENLTAVLLSLGALKFIGAVGSTIAEHRQSNRVVELTPSP